VIRDWRRGAVSVALERRSREKRERTKLLVALFTMIYPWNDGYSRFSFFFSSTGDCKNPSED
jgi:hypothetical protein